LRPAARGGFRPPTDAGLRLNAGLLRATYGERRLAASGWRRLMADGGVRGDDLARHMPMPPRDPAKLEVFQLAHRLVLKVYAVTASLPHTEQFGLQAQLRRAAVSIPTNIVEGCARHSGREYQRFIDIALGSAVEVRYLLQLARELKLLDGVDVGNCSECSDHVVRALHNLQRAIGKFG